ncbi:MAG: c-type cytochrome, partial [Planctomycetota bacterium]
PSQTPKASTTRRWKHEVGLPRPKVVNDGVLELEEIPLPVENPFGRGVRPADVSFFASGHAAVVTFDGDVWICRGLEDDSEEVVWRRFTSGLHEPLSIRIRDEEVFVFDRSGLWRLVDRDGDGEADYHELFCSRLHQSAETREFPLSLELQRDGSFLVIKPGQEGVYSGVLQISADGEQVRLIATGFRQPYLGYDPVTNRVVATDQQGNWVPSSPIHLIDQGGFYGFRRSEVLDELPATPPLTWIPHAECGSATTVVWMRNARMGPLNDKPVLLCYQPPRLMQVHMDIDETAVQGGVTPLDLDLGSKPVMKAAINPADGLLYLTGFQIWGTSAKERVFFARVRADSARSWTLPAQAHVERRGILLRFEQPLSPKSASRREAYTIRRWNYKRTSAYGSGNYRLDGSPGTETLAVSSVKLSQNRKSVFLGVRDMRKVMQIEVGYEFELEDGTPVRRQTFLTAHALRDFDLVKKGFAENEVDLRWIPPPTEFAAKLEPSIERGAELYRQVGCIGCHSIDGSLAGKNGPSWLGLYRSKRKLTQTGKSVVADDAYLRESILNPSAKIAEGAIRGEAGMPIYEGVLRDDQVDSLLLFIKALEDDDGSARTLRKEIAASSSRAWKVDDFRKDLREPLKGRSYENGKMVFLGASCFSCHQLGDGQGGTLGPDLSKRDEKMIGLELLRHILEPSYRIEDKYKSRTILTLDGEVHSGFVVFESDVEIRLSSDPLSNKAPIVIPKTEIEQEKLSDLSPMPNGTLNAFDFSQVLDLLAYIESLGDPDHVAFQALETRTSETSR